MGETRWLTKDEGEAWRPIAALALLLPTHLEEPLHPHGVTFFEYSLLVVLSHAPDRTRRTSELAHLASGSLSRTSHGTRRLEGRGLVQRHRCPEDGRVTLVTLTDEGYQQLVEAAPSHVESVRQAIFDALTPKQATELGRLVTTVLTHMAPTGPWADEADGAQGRHGAVEPGDRPRQAGSGAGSSR